MKTAELTGAALDWAVAKCEGVNDEAFRLFYEPTEPDDYDFHGYPEFHYTTVWSQGGPIIEREQIYFLPHAMGGWFAKMHGEPTPGFIGDTHLIAAMRCYVANKLGDEVEIPEELK